MAFITGVLLRFLSGEPFLGIDAVIEWPGFIAGKSSLFTDEDVDVVLTNTF